MTGNYFLADEGIGYLTFTEFDRFRRAWATALKLLPWWWIAGEIRGGDSDALKTRGDAVRIPLPATYLAAEAITQLMNEFNQWPELEDVARDAYGAVQAKLMTKEVETAAHRWPVEDKPHRVKYFACMSCKQQTLKYYPPEIYKGELLGVRVKCSNKECNAVMDAEMFAFAAAVIEAEEKARERRRLDINKRRAGKGAAVESDDLRVGEEPEGANVSPGPDPVRVSA